MFSEKVPSNTSVNKVNVCLDFSSALLRYPGNMTTQTWKIKTLPVVQNKSRFYSKAFLKDYFEVGHFRASVMLSNRDTKFSTTSWKKNKRKKVTLY